MTDINTRILTLPENVFKTLTQKIYGRFPRPAEIDRQHAVILFRAGLIERSQLGLAPKEYDAAAQTILVPTLECQRAMIALGLVTPGEKQNG